MVTFVSMVTCCLLYDQGENHYAPPPLPPYVNTSTSDDTDVIFDTCHHLLCLYCHRGHSLEMTLDPCASTQYPLDYRIR